MKEYEVFYEGTITITATDENEATEQVYDKLQEACVGEFKITGNSELKCQ